jgi:bifunctional DNase/RNase
MPAKGKPIRVRVKKVSQDDQQRTLVILGTPKRTLPIWIGPAEGQAIAVQMNGVKLARPMTHDLFVAALGEVGWEIEKVVVSDLRETTFYGELHLRSGSKHKVLDCRPSDGLALAVRVKAPIYVAPHVLEAAQGPA